MNNGQTHFQHQDWLGTERLRTSYNGTTEGGFFSLPFGDALSASGTDGDAYHLAGLDHDSESNTDHAQFRQYSPTQGRWLSPDPYSGSYDISNPQTFNRYAYVLNSPMAYQDPLGLMMILVCVGDKEDGGMCFLADAGTGDPPSPRTNNGKQRAGSGGNAPSDPTLKKLLTCPSQAAAASQAYKDGHPFDPLWASVKGSVAGMFRGAFWGAFTGARTGGVALIPFGPAVAVEGAADGAIVGGTLEGIKGAATGPLTAYIMTNGISAYVWGSSVVGCLTTPSGIHDHN